MLFTHDDRRSPTWVKLRKHLTEELDALRRHNDKARSEADTAWTRGEIARVKAILALGAEPKKEPDE